MALKKCDRVLDALWCPVLVFGLILTFASVGAAKTKIQFAFAVERANAPDYVATVDSFNATHPDIEVEYTYIPQASFVEKAIIAMAAGTPAETFYVNDRDVPKMVLAGVMASLDDYIKADKTFTLNGIFPGALNAGRYNGRIYGIPYYYGPHFLYYNRNLFDAAGLVYPNQNSTYDDIASMGKKITKDTNGDGQTDIYGLYIPRTLGWLDKVVYSFGGRYFNDQNTQLKLTEASTIAGFKWYYDYTIRELQIVPIAGTWNTLYADGKLAMAFSYRGYNSFFAQMPNVAMAMTATPKGPVEQYMSAASAVIAMAPGLSVEKSSAAWEFLKWWISDTIQSSTMSKTTIPVTRSALVSADFRNNIVTWENINLLLEVAQKAHPAPVTPAWQNIETVFSGYSTKVMNGQMPVEEALLHVEQEANRLWSEAIAAK